MMRKQYTDEEEEEDWEWEEDEDDEEDWQTFEKTPT